MSTELTVTVTERDGRQALVHPSGEIDLDSTVKLRSLLEHLVRQDARRLIIDMSGVTFCDSTGLSTLITLHKRVARDGGAVVLIAVQPPVRKVLSITGLHQVFELHDSVESARSQT